MTISKPAMHKSHFITTREKTRTQPPIPKSLIHHFHWDSSLNY